MDRIEQLKAKMKARIGPDGKPYPGYAENVEAIKAEIARLENAQASPQGN